MASTRVQVSFVNPVRQGRKSGSIKTTDNQMFIVPPHMLRQFQPGATYQIEYDTFQSRGETYKSVQQVTPIAAPVAESNVVPFSRNDDKTAERIFVCGLINAAVHSGQFRADDQAALQNAVMTCRNVWANTFGDPNSTRPSSTVRPTPDLSGDMNDDIPF